MTNITAKMLAGFFFCTMIFSCKKAAFNDAVPTTETSNQITNNTDPAGSSAGATDNLMLASATTTTSTTTAPLSSFNIDYTNRPAGSYAAPEAAGDFSNIPLWGGNTSIYNGSLKGNLRTTFVKGASGSTGGNVSSIQINDGTQYQIQFKMMYSPSFDFTSGKSGFGLLIGNDNTGSTSGTNGLGGGVRLSFAKTSDGRAVLKPCVYHKDQANAAGDDFGKSYPSTGSLASYSLYIVKMIVKSNTGTNTDGHLTITVNGVSLIDQAIRWTTDDTKRFINKVAFENYSNNAYQAFNGSGYVYYNSVNLTPLSTTSSSTVTPTTPTTPATLYNFALNYTNHGNAAYGLSQATPDFLNVAFWGANTSTYNGALRTTLLANTVGPAGGNVSRVNVPDASEYQLSYDMKFDNNFDFSWGGKVGFGFLIGGGNTGGDPGWDGNGGSLRLMWYKNYSTGPVFLKPYLYYKDQPGTYGDDFGKTYPASGSISKDVWYHVTMYAKSNTGSNTDGRARLVINGTTVLDIPIRWTTNDLQRLINNVSFENFRGGSDSYWQSTTNGDIYFNNINWQILHY